ncbi:hypothetical protein B0H15DRAFT_930816 [Mycena belliarum]|uniref:Uncharacterized protein n=1 Tax=Mycena belliarum TaxID=1033014 RepID=A0AAD6XP30_9AGAR|nr:hypothetical protein B0H15DRAFT_930816 [Mycena belliae]
MHDLTEDTEALSHDSDQDNNLVAHPAVRAPDIEKLTAKQKAKYYFLMMSLFPLPESMKNIKQRIPYDVLHTASLEPSSDGYRPVIEQLPVSEWNTTIPWGRFQNWDCKNWDDWDGPSFESGSPFLTRSLAGVLIKEDLRLSGRIRGIAHQGARLVFTMTGHTYEYFMLLDASTDCFVYKLGCFKSLEDFFARADPSPKIQDIVPRSPGSTVSHDQQLLRSAFVRCGGNLKDLEQQMMGGTRWWDYFGKDPWLKQLVEHPDIVRMIEAEKAAEPYQLKDAV